MVGKGTVQLSFRVGEITPEQERYLKKDVETTRAVFESQRQWGTTPGGYSEVALQVRAALALQRIERRGILVDMAAIERLEVEYKSRMHEAAMLLGSLYRPARVGKRGGTYEAGLQQAQFQEHVAVVAAARLNIEIPRTDTGKVAIGKDDLLPLQGDPLVAQWLEYKTCQKMLVTFLGAWKSSETARIHPRYTLMMRSGRTSSSDPNIQQIPSRGGKGEVKQVFLSEPGGLLYEADYGQIELCCLAYMTQGEMLKQINAGVDVHRRFASWAYEVPEGEVTKEQRQFAKAANFGFPGGLGAKRFREYAMSFGLPDPGERRSQKLLNAWLAAYPEMRRWREDRPSWEFSEKFLAVVAGRNDWLLEESEQLRVWGDIEAHAREYRLPRPIFELLKAHEGGPLLEKWVIHRKVVIAGGRTRCPVSYTEAHNTPFQGLAANLAKEALALLCEEPAPWHLHAYIHDSVLFTAYATEQVEEVRRRMLAASREWIPGVKVEVEINGPGVTWAEAKKTVWRQ